MEWCSTEFNSTLVSGQGFWPSLGCFIDVLVMPSGGSFVIMTFYRQIVRGLLQPFDVQGTDCCALEESRTIQQRQITLTNCLILVVSNILQADILW